VDDVDCCMTTLGLTVTRFTHGYLACRACGHVGNGLTRGARGVFNSADVPRLGVPPSLLLDSATSNTPRTPLDVVGTPFIALTLAEWGSDPNSGSGLQTSQQRSTELGSDPHSAVCTDDLYFLLLPFIEPAHHVPPH